MQRDTGFLRVAAVFVLLCLCAYAAAAGARLADGERTVTAKYVTVCESVTVTGEILRDEEHLSCPFEIIRTEVKDGERVFKGQSLFAGEDGKKYYAPCAGLFGGDKIVRGGWLFRAECDGAEKFYEGQSLVLRMEKDYNATVVKVSDGELTVRCREGLGDVLNTDTARASILTAQYSGISLPEIAVHSDEGGYFVNVSRAGLVRKTYVRLEYSDAGQCIVSADGLGEGMKIFTD